MRSSLALLRRQIEWAAAVGLAPDPLGYVESVEQNLFQPLSPAALGAFTRGGGFELKPLQRRSAKMTALHSSSALAVNFFDYWSGRPLDSVANAMGLADVPVSLGFEAQFPTGLKGTPPHLDVVFCRSGGEVVGVESKFSEWLAPKSPDKGYLKATYFPSDRDLWGNVGLVRAQELADAIRRGSKHFRYLDVPQLLKHMLGLATCHHRKATLCYLFYDWPGPESPAHLGEIAAFTNWIESDMTFHWLTYQDLFHRLSDAVRQEHVAYFDYLERRYFGRTV